eukprot:10746164-Alexandrium_andersonii.AAC.1
MWGRQDLTEASVQARAKHILVRVGADRKQTFAGKTRDQTARLLELVAPGAEVVLLQGRGYGPEYMAVGRSWSGQAMSRAEMMRVDDAAIVGSADWTVASRANDEVGVLVDLNSAGRDGLEAMLM